MLIIQCHDWKIWKPLLAHQLVKAPIMFKLHGVVAEGDNGILGKQPLLAKDYVDVGQVHHPKIKEIMVRLDP